jgi:hypothetical protein
MKLALIPFILPTSVALAAGASALLQEISTGSAWLDYALQQGPMGVVAAGAGYLYWTARKEHILEIKELRAEIAQNQHRHNEEAKTERQNWDNRIIQLQAAWREERMSLQAENTRLLTTHADGLKTMVDRFMELADMQIKTGQQTMNHLVQLREALEINKRLEQLVNSNHPK